MCFSEEGSGWETDIQHDVIEECNKHGGVVHIYVDKNSAEVNVTLHFNLSVCVHIYVVPAQCRRYWTCLTFDLLCFKGNVYVKCPTIPAAMAAVNALHGRYFAGKTSCHMTPVL